MAVAIVVVLCGRCSPLKSHAAVYGRAPQECRKGAIAAPRSFAKVEYRPTYRETPQLTTRSFSCAYMVCFPRISMIGVLFIVFLLTLCQHTSCRQARWPHASYVWHTPTRVGGEKCYPQVSSPLLQLFFCTSSVKR